MHFQFLDWVIVNHQNNVIRTESFTGSYQFDNIQASSERAYLVITPNAFRTDWDEIPQDRLVDQEINTSKPLIFSESVEEGIVDQGENGNYKAGISEQDVTWRMNTDNDSQFFLSEERQRKRFGDFQVDFKSQFFDTRLRDKLGATDSKGDN